MTSLTALEGAFRRVADKGIPTGEYRAVPVLGDDVGPPLAGIDAGGLRHLLMAVDPDLAVLTDDMSVGIKIRRQELVSGSSRLCFVDIASGGEGYNDLFTIVADEILTRWQESGQAPDRVALAVLDRWRHLLSKPSVSRSLTNEELVGLVGELLVLRMIGNRVDLWDGPNGGRHDFVSEVADLEVKATTARGGYNVEIHSLEQLVAPPNGRLCLVFLRLERVSGAGDSLVDLVEAVPNESRVAVMERLASLTATSELLDPKPRRFRLIERQIYLVGDGFPRMVPVDIPQWPITGLTYLRYGIDLAGAIGLFTEVEADSLLADVKAT